MFDLVADAGKKNSNSKDRSKTISKSNTETVTRGQLQQYKSNTVQLPSKYSNFVYIRKRDSYVHIVSRYCVCVLKYVRFRLCVRTDTHTHAVSLSLFLDARV